MRFDNFTDNAVYKYMYVWVYECGIIEISMKTQKLHFK